MSVVAFMLAATRHGPMIVNRLDYCLTGDSGFGVGWNLMQNGAHDWDEVQFLGGLMDVRRHHFGDGVLVIDAGANIGTHTISWAKKMDGWGRVIAIEPQERVFYALAGNIALNNCFNVSAHRAAVGALDGWMPMLVLDHKRPASFGSLELKSAKQEYIGQNSETWEQVRVITIDALADGKRVDFLKIDVEGMELEALMGAAEVIQWHHPMLWVEWIKCDSEALCRWFAEHCYTYFQTGINYLAIHKDDPTLAHVRNE